MGKLLPNWFATSNAVLQAGWPERLALVETNGLANKSHNLQTKG